MVSVPLCREGRDNRLDAFRLGFALLVLVSHSDPITTGSNRGEWFFRATGGQSTAGALSVSAFFAISGFLVAQSWGRCRGLLDFLKRRALRIYPGFVVACLASALVFAPLGADSIPRYAATFWKGGFVKAVLWLQHPPLPPSFVGNPRSGMVNNSLWTIPFEFGCYLILGLIGVAGLLRKGTVVVIFSACFAALLACDLAGHSNDYVSLLNREIPADAINLRPGSDWIRFLTYFFAGASAYLWRETIPRSRRLAIGALAVLAVGTRSSPSFAVALPIAGVYLLFYAAFRPGPPRERGRPDLSYGVYLYAYPVQQLIVSRMPGITPPALTALAIPPVLALAALSWYAVERPMLGLVRRGVGRDRADSPAIG